MSDELKPVTLDMILEEIAAYQPNADINKIVRAYEFAANAHRGQERVSGEPYIVHPMHVAYILTTLHLDDETICAAFLHDVVEDTQTTLEEIEAVFGKNVMTLIDGVTKLGRIESMSKEDVKLENYRKMFLAMAKDIRVIMIKLADRLHNMRTLKYMREDKRQRIARETLEVYAPLANRLGISGIKAELEDLCLRYLEPEAYYTLVEEVKQKRRERQEFIQDAVQKIRAQLEAAGIEAEIKGRAKHFYSIYRKMKRDNKSINEIYDLSAVRVLVSTVKDCYGVLGVIHAMWKPIPGRFKDYIAMPKSNGYQSLHTTVIDEEGVPFEVQIRTEEMHRTAEVGIAAHWKYKEQGGSGEKASEAELAKMNWLHQILEWQNDETDSKEFMKLVKSDFNLFNDNVYCFTPSGDVKNLPFGSCPIDFAYAIHSAVGNRMVGAKVNDRLVPIEYILKNGDRVEIITSQNSRGPSRDWLKIVKSTQARNKINQWFRHEQKDENIDRGKELLDRYAKSKGFGLGELTKPEFCDAVIRRYSYQDWNAILASVGRGGLKESQVVSKLIEMRQKEDSRNLDDEAVLQNIEELSKKPELIRKSKSGIIVKGIHDLAVRYAKCCSPVPGDEIVGFVTRGRGITVHRTDCINMMNLPEDERARLIEAEWQGSGDKETYATELQIFTNNRVGQIVDITKLLADANIDIKALSSRVGKNEKATITVSFDIHNKEELAALIGKLRKINGVLDIERAQG